MSEGASFVHTQRWPVQPSPKSAVVSGIGNSSTTSGGGVGGGRTPPSASGLGAVQQLQQHHPSAHHLGRAQSEMVPRGDEHADHLKKLHAHWSDTGLLQGHSATAKQQLPLLQQQLPLLQQQLRWQLLTSADRGIDSGDEVMRDRRNSFDSAQSAAARARSSGRYAPPFQGGDTLTSPQVVQAALGEVDYVQRRRGSPLAAQGPADDANYMLAFVGGDPSGAAVPATGACLPRTVLTTASWVPPAHQQQQSLPPTQMGIQQWQWPLLSATPLPAAGRSSQHSHGAGLQPSSSGQPSSLCGDGRNGGGGGPAAAAAGGNNEQLPVRTWEPGLLRRVSGSDLTVEGLLQMQRSRFDELLLEVDRQSTYLARLHATGEQLAYHIQEFRSRGQAAAAVASAATILASGGGNSNNSSGGQLSASLTKEMIVKLRLDNSNLLAHIEELQKELTMLRLVATRCPTEGTPALRRDHSMPVPGEGVEHAELSYTWPRGGASTGCDVSSSADCQLPKTPPLRSSAQQQAARSPPDREVPLGDSSTPASLGDRLPDEGDSSGWNCDICTFLNHGMLHVCEMCEAPRMTGRPGHRAACCQQGSCYCHMGVHGSGHL